MIIGKFHELKKSEEGQALVLAALFGLVLMMCVLGTVNLGRAVYDKVQLQAAADSAAYSEAAIEARVMNFTAYTNRAMVVHYASVMAATSYLTWIHFMWAGIKPLLSVLRMIPYVGVVFNIIQQVLQALVTFLDVALAALTPLLSAANLVLYGLQEGAWWSVWARLGRSISPQAHSGDSAAHPYQPIWPVLIPRANQAVFSETRGHLTMPQNSIETLKILLNSRDNEVQMARLHMVEVANSARQPWVAYGDRYANPSPSPLARHFRWKIGCVQAGNVGRTELGGYAPGSGLFGSFQKAPPQIWSGQRFQFATDCVWPIGKRRIPVFTFIAMDQLYAATSPYKQSYFDVWSPSGLVGKGIVLLIPGLKAALSAAKAAANRTKPNPDLRLFWMSPYVYFAPRAGARPGISFSGNNNTGPLGNFAQPDVLIGLRYQGRDYNREPGASKYYGRRFSWNGKGAGRGAVDFRYTDADWPRVPGLPSGLQILGRGLNAFSAAQVYYHRPGEWREMPNFFNPLWGARLIPVVQSNVAATLRFNNPLFTQYLMH